MFPWISSRDVSWEVDIQTLSRFDLKLIQIAVHLLGSISAPGRKVHLRGDRPLDLDLTFSGKVRVYETDIEKSLRSGKYQEFIRKLQQGTNVVLYLQALVPIFFECLKIPRGYGE